jgi:hypothetical protein
MIILLDMGAHHVRTFPGLQTTAIFLVALFGALTLRGGDLATSYYPVRTLTNPEGFSAAQFGGPIRPDSLLRSAAAAYPQLICAWMTGDYGEDKGRNYLEAGINTEFVLRKNSRYPLIVTIPLNTVVGDEQYFLGPHFAYVSTGVNLRVPLSFIPSRYGKWTAGNNADLCYYGTTAAEFVHSFGFQVPKIAAVLSVEL